MFIKISNLSNNGVADYKGLDLDLIQAGTQIYPEGANEAYFYYIGDVAGTDDIEIIDEQTYLSVKQAEDKKPKPPTQEERISALEDTITAMLGL